MKRMLIILASVIVTLFIGYLAVVNLYPTFGGKLTKADQKKYENSKQFNNGKFENANDVSLNFGVKDAFKYFTTKTINGTPKQDLQPIKLDSLKVANYTTQQQPGRLIWYGHSAFLLQIKQKNILIDPMFGKFASPFPMGAKRFNSQLPLEIEQLPQIDAVVISHDHYDHLDYDSIQKLKAKVNQYIVPLGVGIHLKAWGVSSEKITELDWWQNTTLGSVELVCTPAQHFSGRKVGNKPSTLWSSWVIQTPEEKLFFSGDGGYAQHFKEIGEKYGPFNLALMECGQYNEMWQEIHCMPEETAQAGVDVRAEKMMPIHWAGFKLAAHDWREPMIRVSKKANELNLPLITPRIGEEIFINQPQQFTKWWEEINQ